MRKIILVAFMLMATGALAQPLDLKFLDKFEAKAKETTRIDLDESMLKSAAGFLNEKKDDESAAKKSTANLKGFFLRSFEFEERDSYKVEDLKPLRDQLKAPDWVVFLQSKEKNELTEIWMHRTRGEADGMLLISAEASELTVIYGVGITNVGDFAKIGSQLGGPNLELSSPKKDEKP